MRMMRLVAGAAIWACWTVAVAAHPLAAAAAGHWEWEPFIFGPIAVSAAFYVVGLRRLWRHAGVGAGIATWQAACFAAGSIALVAALDSPVAWLSDVLLSAHMAQHMLLMLVAAPLLAFSQPLFVWMWALQPDPRRAAVQTIRRPWVLTAWHHATAPFAVFALQGIALWLWHIPSWYEAALRHEALHALQHLSFVVAAALFWWAMAYGRYGRRGYGLAVLYVFLTGVHSSVLGALLTTAPSLWYHEYSAPAHRWRVDALADQQLAGLLMWVPAGVVFLVLGLALFAAWLGETERRAGYATVDTILQQPPALRATDRGEMPHA